MSALLFWRKKNPKLSLILGPALSNITQKRTKIFFFLFLLFDSCRVWKMLWNVCLNYYICSKIKKIWLLLVKRLNIGKRAYSLSSNPCQSLRERPKILKICQITKFDMGFQKIDIRSRLEKVDFLPQAKIRRSLS